MSNQPIRALLVEDNPTDRLLIHEALMALDVAQFELADVERLANALQQLRQAEFDVILLDLSLPDSQGLATLMKLLEHAPRTPIIVLTDLADEALGLRAVQAGAQDYLVKGHVAGGGLARAIRYAIERKRADVAQRFLAAAGTLLAASLDDATTLDRVARLAVPDLADWCAVHMLEADGRIYRLALAHVDPARIALVRTRPDRYLLDPQAEHLVPHVIHTGRPELCPETSDALLLASARDAEHLETLRWLGLASYICVPLVLQGRTFGAITLALGESQRCYGPDDLALAEELARRTAIALDNARLYQLAQAEIAERQRVEATLRESQERLAGIIGSAMDAIISIDAAQRIVVFNRAAEQMFGCSAEAAIGQPIDRFIPPPFRSVHATHIHAFGQTGVTSRSTRSPGNLTALRADGTEFPIEATISQTVATGQPLYTVIMRDISARTQAHAALRASEDRYRQIVETALLLNHPPILLGVAGDGH